MATRQQLGPEEDNLEENVVVAATFKVLVLGNSNVGKSSLIKYYSAAEKPEKNMMPTIGLLNCVSVYVGNYYSDFSEMQLMIARVCGPQWRSISP